MHGGDLQRKRTIIDDIRHSSIDGKRPADVNVTVSLVALMVVRSRGRRVCGRQTANDARTHHTPTWMIQWMSCDQALSATSFQGDVEGFLLELRRASTRSRRSTCLHIRCQRPVSPMLVVLTFCCSPSSEILQPRYSVSAIPAYQELEGLAYIRKARSRPRKRTETFGADRLHFERTPASFDQRAMHVSGFERNFDSVERVCD